MSSISNHTSTKTPNNTQTKKQIKSNLNKSLINNNNISKYSHLDVITKRVPQKEGMNFKLSLLSKAILGLVLSSTTLVNTASAEDGASELNNLEVITITSQRYKGLTENESVATGKTSTPDLAHWLSSVPGANINSNGPITGVAQYRGLYGDRVNVSLDGHPVIGAGPNAMDTPLSYSTPLIVDSMMVYRGVAPVSTGIDTLGGAIEVNMRKAEQTGLVTGDLQAGYRSNNNAKTLSGVSNINQGNVALLVYANSQKGDNMESGDGINISPTAFDKIQLGGDIRYAKSDNEIGLSYHYTDTGDSGTPALPMDIEFIESHRVTMDGLFSFAQWDGVWQVGYIDADHGMTNFLMRQNNNPTKFRRNNAQAQTTDFKFSVNKAFLFGDITVGADGYFATHESLISNPNNAMFSVVNFNDVEDNRFGIFTQWQRELSHNNLKTDLQFGIRLKQSSANAGEVNSSMSGMMNMMGGLVGKLQDDFNQAQRSVTDNNIDIALNSQTQLSRALSFSASVGMKNRAPSYQERYLWMPMEATGGLADGHTYIGDINLDSETAYQLDLGLTFKNKIAMLAPHVFYERIDNYIQGTPMAMADKEAKMLANMMSGDTGPLKFSNVEATLFGADVNGYLYLTSDLQLSGVISYVEGERADITDNLYRIAPLNGHVSLRYAVNDWSVSTTLMAAAQQSKVSYTNAEKKSSGYGVMNVEGQYYVNNDMTLRMGVDNVFNKNYRNHLGGYNRVKGTGTQVMARLPSEGLSAWVELTYSL
jgi:iron complex outermembrane receptor protein